MTDSPIVIWSLVITIGALLALLFVTSVRLRDLKRELRNLARSLDRLDERLNDQERRLAKVQSALESRGSDLFTPVWNAVRKLRTKGWLPVLSLVSTHLFKAYLDKRRQRSLPRKELSEK